MDPQDKFSVGQSFLEKFKIDASTVERFAEFSGDRNPLHLELQAAQSYGYPRQVAHGTILIAFISRMIGMEVPGPGAMWVSNAIEWTAPVFVGDEIELRVTVEKVSVATGILILHIVATNQKGKVVATGSAKVKRMTRVAREDSQTGQERRVALVTGGSRGIGAAIARRLSLDNTTVAINYRESQQDAENVVEEIRSSGGLAQAYAGDIAEPGTVVNIVHEVIASFGRLDMVVHGASPNILSRPIDTLNYNAVEQYLRIYLGGTLALMSEARPGMVERKFGRFILIGTSFLFGIPPAGLSAYVIAKQALWGLVRSMATELGPVGITSNMVSPSLTVTDMTADISARVKELEARKSPLRRLVSPRDTAELVAFLASDAGGYINGSNLPVTGGPV
jgi:3-oxoacyl-[acyl-carrier protein] reductase